MLLRTERYQDALEHWPEVGKVILAQYDEENIVVYQAFSNPIADYAVEHQSFGGSHYSFSRMSWIKPNFLWMMYRCGWLQKDALQARVLAITIKRSFFDEVLASAVSSSFDRTVFSTQAEWKLALKESEVRLQWDPDHLPNGAKTERRAIQLGLRGEFLRRLGKPVAVEDISNFVRESHGQPLQSLMVPEERLYPLV